MKIAAEPSWRRQAAALAMGLLLGCPSLALLAAQTNGSFIVRTMLTGGAPSTGLCRNTPGASAFGTTVTVVCSTGVQVGLEPANLARPWAPTHGGAFRYVTQVSSSSELLGTVDIYSGVGTVTALRVVSFADKEYLEMTVGW
jgi:hypothetical protein